MGLLLCYAAMFVFVTEVILWRLPFLLDIYLCCDDSFGYRNSVCYTVSIAIVVGLLLYYAVMTVFVAHVCGDCHSCWTFCLLYYDDYSVILDTSDCFYCIDSFYVG